MVLQYLSSTAKSYCLTNKAERTYQGKVVGVDLSETMLEMAHIRNCSLFAHPSLSITASGQASFSSI
jgi:hypothetical protein